MQPISMRLPSRLDFAPAAGIGLLLVFAVSRLTRRRACKPHKRLKHLATDNTDAPFQHYLPGNSSWYPPEAAGAAADGSSASGPLLKAAPSHAIIREEASKQAGSGSQVHPYADAIAALSITAAGQVPRALLQGGAPPLPVPIERSPLHFIDNKRQLEKFVQVITFAPFRCSNPCFQPHVALAIVP